jgi:hypothetical protein
MPATSGFDLQIKKHAGVFDARRAFVEFQMKRLDGFNVFRFQAFFALDNVKTHLLSLVQRLEAAGLDSAEVHENIRAALLFDEAEAFAFVEPLYFTF